MSTCLWDFADVIGVVQSVAPLTLIRRKTTNEEIPKREVTIADQRFVTPTLQTKFLLGISDFPSFWGGSEIQALNPNMAVVCIAAKRQ